MKILIIILIIISITISSAAIITVDNKTPSIGDYATIQAAHDAASNGDTIIVHPSNIPYLGIFVTKRLHLMGTGFDDPTEAVKKSLISGTFFFNPGSEGSVIEGFLKGGLQFKININTDNLTVRRNKLNSIFVKAGNIGTVIIQNHLQYDSYYLLSIDGSNELFVANNVFKTDGGTVKGILANLSSISVRILNNIFYSSGGTALDIAEGAYPASNIIVAGSVAGNAEFYNNMCNGTQLPNSNGNILNVDMSTFFVDYPNYDFNL